MNDAVDVIKIRQPFENGQGDLAHDVNVDRTNLLVYAVKGPLVHKFHTDADVRVRQESAPE